MNIISKRIVAIFMVVIILAGIPGLFSLSFVKGVGRQVLYGYRENSMPEGATTSQRIKRIFTKIEDMIEISFTGEYVNLNGLVQKSMGKKVISDVVNANTVVKLDNGYLTFVFDEYKDTAHYAKSVADLRSFVKNTGSDFLYIQAPYKNFAYGDKIPDGVNDFIKDTTKGMVSNIKSNGVETLDLSIRFTECEVNGESMFFRTDHHWTVQGAFNGFRMVADELKENYNFTFDEKFLSQDNYTVETRKGSFLGSQGRRVGKFYAGMDDLSLMYPKFETDFSFEIPNRSVSKQGTFKEVMFDFEKLEPKNFVVSNNYLVFIGGDYDLTVIKNNLNNNGKKIVLIKDSFSCAFAPFLSLITQELHLVDLRYFKNSELKNYIKSVSPDLTIVMYNCAALYDNDDFFDFN